jgi:hypothetical protein
MLDRVATELVAQSSQQLGRITLLLPTSQAGLQ